ncbi:MAG: hypothetical protein ACF8GE_09460 [Phycisphaerales bacterium JB043]
MDTRLRRIALVLVSVMLAATSPTPTLAQQEQSPAQLRNENEQLREKIEQLERQLASAQRRIQSLESTNERLRQRLDNSGSRPSTSQRPETTPEEPERQMAPIPDDPFAAPVAMHAMLQREYQRVTDGMSFDSASDRDEYLRTIRRWAQQSRRDINGPINWTARVLESTGGRGKVGFTIEVIDQSADLPIGETFQIEVVGRNVQKLESAIGGDPIQIDGVFSGTISIDDSTDASEDPMFIGPFATLDFRVNIRSVR